MLTLAPFFLQQLLHFFGNFKRYVFFARTVRADCPRVAAAMPGIKRNLFAFQPPSVLKLLLAVFFSSVLTAVFLGTVTLAVVLGVVVLGTVVLAVLVLGTVTGALAFSAELSAWV